MASLQEGTDGDRQVRVKICGLRDAETIRSMNGLPVHEVGFIFAKSRRQISPALASELVAEVHKLRNPEGHAPRTVGVFVNPTIDVLRETLQAAPLDVIQLHGEETPQFCEEVRRTFGTAVWKVFSVTDSDADDSKSSGPDRLEPYRGSVDAFLVDTAGGGTGKTFAWHVIDRYAEAAAGIPLYVAGGLHPDNVGELLSQYSPDGVDVSSGVETDGVKDRTKIKVFAERVQGL
ncbi:phosphoribosylanthranilate isomerase [Paenibacillus sacheonensis]|uniref:N-(5'-phosphoribosyl)anthranilate isomerase n=1 Tax=Paenibacillus sacheonensis TaxID=742054 RepID=A0A7X4YP89_9BACL|nr:phosphoribosylanthranilate isomerase [Paenibacillus sacheonensis]MBM7564500.1 phosphoribosylanthranilate isomerase [Paenibacillus sacheonensis]NBC69059.1 phosphoribosylanthranilate isomerase [Paenibacillus sacheonensis]